MKKIALGGKLGKGQFAIVDDENYEELATYKWHWMAGYAQRYAWDAGKGRGVNVRMHREILCATPDIQVDHINGNRLDNRRSNLRLVTSKQNNQNRGPRSTNPYGFKGVSWSKSMKKWRACIGTPPNRIHIGYYDSVLSAAYCYNKAAMELFGDYARLNDL